MLILTLHSLMIIMDMKYKEVMLLLTKKEFLGSQTQIMYLWLVCNIHLTPSDQGTTFSNDATNSENVSPLIAYPELNWNQLIFFFQNAHLW